jgi:decaprenylphospho-beta-D-ribofuranose 2-oxidase
MPLLPNDHLERLEGWGGAVESVGYVFRPTTVDGIKEVFQQAKDTGRKVTLRGAGRSYGDASLGSENIVLEITRMNRILEWDPATGIITCEPGVTIEQLWKYCIADGWWPPVVSGTMYPTLAGCLGMNIHGKNNFHAGPIGDHILSFDFLSPNGELHHVTKDDELFYSVISSFGMLGSFTKITLQMKKVYSGLLDINVFVANNFHELFEIYNKHIGESDYLVGWIDAFGSGKQLGRAVVHQANYLKQGEDSRVAQTLRVENQMLPDTIMGFIPKSIVWIFLRPFMNDFGMKLVNWAKFISSKIPFLPKSYKQSHAAFAFLLDYVPGWKKSYGKGGLIQYQSFLPKETAEAVYRKQLELCQAEKLAPYLAVFKRHRPDKFLMSHAVDGYSLALDFKVTDKNREALWKLCHKMNDIVLAGGGRFYFAKDATLRSEDLAYLGTVTLEKLKRLKSSLDPDSILETDLSRRLFHLD